LLHQHGDLLSSYLSHNHWYVVRNLVWVLGRLGPGAEPAVAQALNYEHPQVRREAVRSLSLLGTSAATHELVLLLESGDRELRRMAAEQLPSVPSEIVLTHLRDLLKSRSFVQRDSYVIRQCIDLLGRVRGPEAEELLGRLHLFRFYLWNWRLLRVGWAAHAMLRTHRGRGV